MVVHLGDGRWWDDERQAWRCGKGRAVRRRPQPVDHEPPGRTTRVVLATCHRDHDPMNNAAENPAALCQRCHILHDKAEHLRRQRLTYLARRALGDLFTGLYRDVTRATGRPAAVRSSLPALPALPALAARSGARSPTASGRG